MTPNEVKSNKITVVEKSECMAMCYGYKNRKYNYHLIILDGNGEIVYTSDLVAVTDGCLNAVVNELAEYWNNKISAE